ncbi:MAG: acylneuraminate cytidylyltransferase [Candidatus Hydrogenedentota bacterium]|nr:MAG: acylneuraminate cytidylyltransferase [Candidatus Hydrogenedentota bacterium]
MTAFRTGLFIQARMSSARFPGKVLNTLRGHPLLEWSVRRARRVASEAVVAVLTGEIQANDPIRDWCRKYAVPCFSGSEEDVLGRYASAVRHFDVDTVVRLTADNPLFDVGWCRTLLAAHREARADYSSCKAEAGSRLPEGVGSEVFTAELLEDLDRKTLSASDREHVNEYVLRNKDAFRVLVLGAETPLESAPSLTIDTPEDLERVEAFVCRRGITLPR